MTSAQLLSALKAVDEPRRSWGEPVETHETHGLDPAEGGTVRRGDQDEQRRPNGRVSRLSFVTKRPERWTHQKTGLQ